MKPQRGFVALLMMVLIAAGIFGAMAAWVASNPPRSKQSINQQVLAQAKEALLAYVAVRDTPANMLTLETRLPCPDRIGDGVADSSTGTCLAIGETAFGLLPWTTLGLPPLRDADGECLWYAVSGDFKDAAPTAIARPINADTDGRITVSDEAGRTLATQLVAVVFAPGTNLTQQARNAMAGGADKPCVTPSSNAIADAALYLDKIVLSRATINNAQPAPAASAPVNFAQSAGSAAKQLQLNDQLAWITTEDYAATATQRNAEVLKQELNLASAAAGGRMPFASLTPGGTCDPGRYSGFLPSFCSYINTTAGTIPITFTFDIRTLKTTRDEWPEQAFYAVTPECTFGASNCDMTTGSALLALPTNPTAKAVVLMRGRRQLNPSSCPPTTPTSTLSELRGCIESTKNQTALSDDPMTKLPRTFVTPGSRPTSNDILKELK
jgi:hypothetical protein